MGNALASGASESPGAPETTKELARVARRLSDLLSLSEGRVRDGFGGRVARAYAWGIALSYAAFAWFGGGDGRELLLRALFTLAWITGSLLALSAARDLERIDIEEGVTALVVQRGFSERFLELARVLAAARRIALSMGLPAVVLVVLLTARATSLSAVGSGALAVLGAAAFSGLSGLLLAALARGSAHAFPSRGRTLLVLFVLAPYAAQAVLPWLPSVPSLLGGLGHFLIPVSFS